MKQLYIFLLLISGIASAQDKFVLTANGFDPVEIPRPNRTDEKLIEAAKSWNDVYNKQEHDNYDVTTNSLRIEAWRDNGFYYRNVGETYSCNIKYTLSVTFEKNVCRLQFSVKEIYAKQTLLKMTTSDMFTPDGKLKDDFEEAKQSLEKTANNVLKSFAKYVSTY